MKVAIYMRGSTHQSEHAQALEQGLRAIGIQPHIGSPDYADVVACWGWRVGKRLSEAGATVLVLERGYLGDRFRWTSIGWDGLNGRAYFPPAPDDGGARFVEYFGNLVKPWRSGGEYSLLIGQVPGDAALGGLDLRSWYAEQAQALRARFDLPVVFRPHPLANKRGGPPQRVSGTQLHEGALADALERAAVVVTFNSNTAVESVLAGVPTIACDRGSMAWPMCSHSIADELVQPDRARWCAELAWKQWTLAEIANGAAVGYAFQFLPRAA